jgi:hypothetical protein
MVPMYIFTSQRKQFRCLWRRDVERYENSPERLGPRPGNCSRRRAAGLASRANATNNPVYFFALNRNCANVL